MPDSNHNPTTLISLPTDKLLEKFGAGGHKPGSGTAAAFLGLLACKLLQTVILLTHGRDQYKGVTEQLTLANQEVLTSIEPKLLDAFQEDSVQFEKVILARRKRDEERDPKMRRALSEKALGELREATVIPLNIAELSLNLAEKALTVFDLGFQSARGDSAVAISAALASGTGSIGIVLLNLTSFKGSEWAVDIRNKADMLNSRAASLLDELNKRIDTLRQEVLKRENSPRENS